MPLPTTTTNPGQKEPIHTTTFVQRTSSLTGSKSGGWSIVGSTYADGKAVPQEYIINITSIRNNATVVCPIQEPIQKRVESRWEPFIPSSILGEANISVQAITKSKKSVITKALTRRIWSGSSPMTLSMNLKFNAVNNPVVEVLEPMRILESMALPSDPSGGRGVNLGLGLKAIVEMDVEKAREFYDSIPVMSPPGPSPFVIDGVVDLGDTSNKRRIRENEIREGKRGGDIIVVEIGRFLTFYNVIMKEVTSTTPVMFNKNGDPISSSVSITFETYEMITTEGLGDIYSKNSLGQNG